MAESARTPGPWTVTTCAPLHREEVLGRLQGMARLVVAVPRRQIRRRRGEPVRWAEPDAETRANLQLIAAAPELLEQLKVVESALLAIPCSDPGCSCTRRLLPGVQAVIAKAEGRADG